MGIEGLVRVLERKARAKAAEVLREARAEAARIRQEAETEVERRRKAFLEEREAELRAELEEETAEARRRARIRTLEARQEVLERVFAEARERLGEAAGSPAHLRVLPERLAAALRYLEDGGAVVRCAPDLERAVREAGEGRVEVNPDSELEAGFVAASADGSARVDETAQNRLERMRRGLAMEIVARLEAGSASEDGPGERRTAADGSTEEPTPRLRGGADRRRGGGRGWTGET